MPAKTENKKTESECQDVTDTTQPTLKMQRISGLNKGKNGAQRDILTPIQDREALRKQVGRESHYPK